MTYLLQPALYDEAPTIVWPWKERKGCARAERWSSPRVEKISAHHRVAHRDRGGRGGLSPQLREGMLDLVRGVQTHVNARKLPPEKRVFVSKSLIHHWGLFAAATIEGNDTLIEYVGEIIRARVADSREAKYRREGIGSSYFFRTDAYHVIDATKRGNIARFTNHCCEPNCKARIVEKGRMSTVVLKTAEGVDVDEELTYDYKFSVEESPEDKVECHCGAARCKRFMN